MLLVDEGLCIELSSTKCGYQRFSSELLGVKEGAGFRHSRKIYYEKHRQFRGMNGGTDLPRYAEAGECSAIWKAESPEVTTLVY